VGLFRPYERKSAEQASPVEPSIDETSVEGRGPRKKDAPTPTRKQAEAARRERIRPSLSPKQQKAASREAQRLRRADAFAKADNTPEKVLLRDYVDAKWHLSEFLMPVLIVLMAFSFIATRNVNLLFYTTVGTWVLLAAAIVDIALTWRGYKKLARERLRNPNFRNMLFYAVNRLIQIRRFRVPGPRIERGGTY